MRVFIPFCLTNENKEREGVAGSSTGEDGRRRVRARYANLPRKWQLTLPYLFIFMEVKSRNVYHLRDLLMLGTF